LSCDKTGLDPGAQAHESIPGGGEGWRFFLGFYELEEKKDCLANLLTPLHEKQQGKPQVRNVFAKGSVIEVAHRLHPNKLLRASWRNTCAHGAAQASQTEFVADGRKRRAGAS
jgi:hypothetical protein